MTNTSKYSANLMPCTQLLMNSYSLLNYIVLLCTVIDAIYYLHLCSCIALLLLVTAAVRRRCGHYIFCPVVSSSSPSSFPRLISAVGDWMSTIVPHMVWP